MALEQRRRARHGLDFRRDAWTGRLALLHAGDPDRGEHSARVDYADQGRARMMGRNRGQLKLHADRSGTLLGAEMAMPGAEHVAQLVAWAVQEGMIASHLLDRPFYHPTIEEGLKQALTELAGRTA